MKVRLVKKYAELIDGVDLTGRQVGDVFDLPREQARLLLAEEWATRERRYHSGGSAQRRRSDDHPPPRDT
jgi:hypothetical protein